ncbi:MAG: TonB-dependent receptor, partial [Sphingomonadales bacterium]
AFTGNQLREMRVERPMDISAMTPGLFATGSRGESNPIFTIRGIGLNDVFSNNNPTVGVYVDEVVQPFTPMLGFQMFDLERVEVLKGPQGTLYGRNTTGGAINFVTRKPSDEFDAYGSLTYGRFGRFELEGAVGGPVADGLSVRLSGKTTQQSGGWQTNAVTGEKVGDQDKKAVRAQILWEPSNSFDVLVRGNLYKENSDQQLREHLGFADGAFSSTPCQGFLEGRRDEGPCVSFLGYFDPTEDRRTVENSAVFGHENDVSAEDVAVTMNWHLPSFTVTSITAYNSYLRTAGEDSDGTPLAMLDSLFTDDIEAFSQEFRLTSNDEGPLSWVVGAFYTWDRIDGNIVQALDDHIFTTRIDVDWDQRTKASALFGQAEYMVTDQVRLIGGLRWTDETKKFRYDAIDLDPFGTSVNLPTPVAGINDKLSEDKISGKIGVDFLVNDDLMLYASASKGFKSGGYKAAIAFDAPELEPFFGETLYAYEVGAKSTLMDGRLQLNAAGYYYDWEDFQAFVTEIRDSINVIVLSNAGDARIWGFELDATAYPADGLMVRGAFNYMDTKIKNFNTAPGAADNTGNELANSPEYSLSGTVRYQFPTDHLGFGMYALGDASYRSRVFYSLSNNLQNSQKGYALLNARVGFTSPDERWEFAVWGRNLTNKFYVSQSYDNFGGIFPSQNFLGDPRTYGATLAFRY